LILDNLRHMVPENMIRRILLLAVMLVGSEAWQAALPRRTDQATIWRPISSSLVMHARQDALEEQQQQQTHSGVNGDDGNEQQQSFHKLESANLPAKDGISAEDGLPEAPPLSYTKFLTMQEKRAVVQVRYSEDAGLKPYFLTVAKKLKASHPDVIIERQILSKMDKNTDADEPTFEIVVDGKVVVGNGKGRPRKAKISRMDMLKGRSIYVSMADLDLAICRARRRLRPTTVYGEQM